MTETKVKISPGNSKLGRIPNISLTPGQSCRPGVSCLKDCYAQNAYRMYPSTRQAWDGNLEIYRTDPVSFFEQVAVWLIKRRVDWFRWHVGGDIPDPSTGGICEQWP